MRVDRPCPTLVRLTFALLGCCWLGACREPEPLVLAPLPPGLAHPWEMAATVPAGAVTTVAVARASSLVETSSQACAALARELAEGMAADAARVAALRVESVVPADQLPTSLRGRRVDVNHASSSELQRLPRVGPAMAARIIEGRPYGSIDDLLRVRGIGPATLQAMAPELWVGAVDAAASGDEGSGDSPQIVVFDEVGVIEAPAVQVVEPVEQVGE